MKQEDFSTIFRRSAIKRTKLAGLQRNAIKIKANDKTHITNGEIKYFSHNATALLLQFITKSISREWTPAFTFVLNNL